MTAKELYEQKIVPLRMELQKLEREYKELYQKECGEKIGARASCRNCAYSCVQNIGDHNFCMGGKCTCCYDWCYTWIPENEVSKFLRANYHYKDDMFYRLEDIFGDGFLKKCNDPKKVEIVMDMLQRIALFDGKMEGDD